MADIHLIQTTKTEINESVMEVLDALMEDAKAGKIVALAAVVIRPDDCMNCTFSQSDRAPQLLGAIQLLSHRILASLE